MKIKIFITGSSGFIGFHTAKKFLDKGLIDKKDFNKKTENFKKVLLDDNAIEGNPSFFNSSYVKVVGVSSVFILVLSYLVGPFDKIF